MKRVVMVMGILGIISLGTVGYSQADLADGIRATGFAIGTANWNQPTLALDLNDHDLTFTLQHIANYVTVDYTVTYTREGGIGEQVSGSVDNSSGQDELTSPEIYLGTCSSGVCVPQEASDISVSVKLAKYGGEEMMLTENL